MEQSIQRSSTTGGEPKREMRRLSNGTFTQPTEQMENMMSQPSEGPGNGVGNVVTDGQDSAGSASSNTTRSIAPRKKDLPDFDDSSISERLPEIPLSIDHMVKIELGFQESGSQRNVLFPRYVRIKESKNNDAKTIKYHEGELWAGYQNGSPMWIIKVVDEYDTWYYRLHKPDDLYYTIEMDLVAQYDNTGHRINRCDEDAEFVVMFPLRQSTEMKSIITKWFDNADTE